MQNERRKDPNPVEVEGLNKVFRSGEAELVLFENLSFHVSKGTTLAIVEQSSAGKSTLLYILVALDRPSAGAVAKGNSRPDAKLWHQPWSDAQHGTQGMVPACASVAEKRLQIAQECLE